MASGRVPRTVRIFSGRAILGRELRSEEGLNRIQLITERGNSRRFQTTGFQAAKLKEIEMPVRLRSLGRLTGVWNEGYLTPHARLLCARARQDTPHYPSHILLVFVW